MAREATGGWSCASAGGPSVNRPSKSVTQQSRTDGCRVGSLHGRGHLRCPTGTDSSKAVGPTMGRTSRGFAGSTGSAACRAGTWMKRFRRSEPGCWSNAHEQLEGCSTLPSSTIASILPSIVKCSSAGGRQAGHRVQTGHAPYRTKGRLEFAVSTGLHSITGSSRSAGR